jgi:hypothetical protein
MPSPPPSVSENKILHSWELPKLAARTPASRSRNQRPSMARGAAARSARARHYYVTAAMMIAASRFFKIRRSADHMHAVVWAPFYPRSADQLYWPFCGHKAHLGPKRPHLHDLSGGWLRLVATETGFVTRFRVRRRAWRGCRRLARRFSWRFHWFSCVRPPPALGRARVFDRFTATTRTRQATISAYSTCPAITRPSTAAGGRSALVEPRVLSILRLAGLRCSADRPVSAHQSCNGTARTSCTPAASNGSLLARMTMGCPAALGASGPRRSLRLAGGCTRTVRRASFVALQCEELSRCARGLPVSVAVASRPSPALRAPPRPVTWSTEDLSAL